MNTQTESPALKECRDQRDQLRAQLLQAQAVCRVKDECLRVIDSLVEKECNLSVSNAVNSAVCIALSHTAPPTLLDEVVKALEDLIAACPHEFEGWQRAVAAKNAQNALSLLRGEQKS